MPSVFFSYSHVDEALRDQIETQLSMLKRQGVIETWHDRRVGAGQEFARAIEKHVEIDDIILILIRNFLVCLLHLGCRQVRILRQVQARRPLLDAAQH